MVSLSLTVSPSISNECAKFIDGSVKAARLVTEFGEDTLLNPAAAKSKPLFIGLSYSPEGVKSICMLSLMGQITGFVSLQVFYNIQVTQGTSTRVWSFALLGLSTASSFASLLAV